MSTDQTPVLRGLPKKLVNLGYIDKEVAAQLNSLSHKNSQSFVGLLLADDLLSASVLANLASTEFGLPLFDLDAFNVDHSPKSMLDETLIQKHEVLPLFQRGNRLFLGISDPTNQHAITEVRFHSGMNVEPILVEHDKLLANIERYLSANDTSLRDVFSDLEESALENIDLETARQEDEDDKGESEAPIIRYVNKMLIDAIKTGASDIHFEPYEKSYRIRYRIDGILTSASKPPTTLASRLAARLKVMAQLDISERRLPQDGRIKLKVSKKKTIDFRVNTLPTLFGEKIVLRILDSSQAKMGIDSLGYEEDQREAYLKTLEQSQGMILVTGPTGSGKTVSLYTGLSILNTVDRNISTAEDPVEINLEGINQVQINSRVGFTFAEALRAFLRQDPDVIMVGEIRDLETAEIAIKASQTGHLVLSTLHTNSAPETLTRLLNMGVPAFNVATSVNLIIAQRLARRLCPNCKEPYDEIPQKILQEEGFTAAGFDLDELTIYHAVGCKMCTNGYKGRIGVYEVLNVTPAISRAIMNGGNSITISDEAKKEGFRTLRQSALQKVARGIISLEEANRITKD
jgi:type IV pilus assembly protein PilB